MRFTDGFALASPGRRPDWFGIASIIDDGSIHHWAPPERILEEVGLVEPRKVGRWAVYTRDEKRIRQLRQAIIDQLSP